MHVGYFGVIIPEFDFYQGYFIDDCFQSKATAALERYRVRLDLTDQNLLGSISAAIATCASNDDRPRLAVLSLIMRSLLKQSYFIIIAHDYRADPMHTEVQPLSVASIAEARTCIEHHLHVLATKRRLLPQAFTKVFSKPH